MPDLNKAYRLEHKLVEKVWGSTQLEPWFPNSDKKIGEAWFVEPHSSLLIKFLFTTEHLSVQVHPNDEQARIMENGSRGKTEMWHILRAEPGAQLAMGLVHDLEPEELRTASLDGSIMDLLRWIPAIPGETWFIPAGTIHAIGAGITLAEVQQNSDVTYRLFDYSRPRELHLDSGVAVSNVNARPDPAGDFVKSNYFLTDVIHSIKDLELDGGLAVIIRGEGMIDGEPFRPGEVWQLSKSVMTGTRCDILWVRETNDDTNNHQSGR